VLQLQLQLYVARVYWLGLGWFGLIGRDGEVSRMEFLTKMLVRLGRAEQQDIDEILAQFDVLDEDRSGTLDMNDIVEGLKKQEQREQREQWEQPQHQLAMPP
jgi:hypothetical protein